MVFNGNKRLQRFSRSFFMESIIFFKKMHFCTCHFHRHDDRDSVETVQVGESPRSSSRSSCRKNKRRRVDQTGNAHNPDFIDLTDVTDQDEAASVRVLEEINHSPYLDSSIVLDANRFVVV